MALAHLGPVQGDPLRRAGLVVAGLPLDGPVGQAVAVLHRLLLGRLDPPDAQHGPGPHAPVTRLPTLGPVPDKPPVRDRGERGGRETGRLFCAVKVKSQSELYLSDHQCITT